MGNFGVFWGGSSGWLTRSGGYYVTRYHVLLSPNVVIFLLLRLSSPSSSKTRVIFAAMSSSLPIIWRSNSEEYEKARIGRVFNHRRPERSPLAVVAPTCTSHIIDTVLLAIQRECRISVRSGGHSWAAWSVRDDAILIDLGNFREISLDEKTGIVKASPSTTGRMLNSFLAEKGRMFAGGHCPDVGLGGFLLQGGMGWNCKASLNMRSFAALFSFRIELGLGVPEYYCH